MHKPQHTCVSSVHIENSNLVFEQYCYITEHIHFQSADMFGSILLCFGKSMQKKKKKLPPLTHPPKFGCKTSTCSTLCISSYQILTTTWKQIIITQILPVSMWIIKYESYTSVSIHFLWWDWHINSNAWPDV